MYRARFLTSMDDIGTIKCVRARVDELRAEDDDARDLLAVFVLAYDEMDAPCGCGRMYIDAASHFRIDQLGVLKRHRGRYIGDLMARMLLYRAQKLNAGSIYALCPPECVGFFARYGFKPTPAGERADEQIDMYVSGNDISLSGKCHMSGADACDGHCDVCGARA